jgi:hypothetical protein
MGPDIFCFSFLSPFFPFFFFFNCERYVNLGEGHRRAHHAARRRNQNGSRAVQGPRAPGQTAQTRADAAQYGNPAQNFGLRESCCVWYLPLFALSLFLPPKSPSNTVTNLRRTR